MTFSFTPRDHYWTVNDDAGMVYSSKRKSYVPASDGVFAAWLAAGNRATRIASEAELWDVLAQLVPDLLPTLPAALDRLKERQLDGLDAAMLKFLMNHENRIRVLESKPAVTAAQMRSAIKALL